MSREAFPFNMCVGACHTIRLQNFKTLHSTLSSSTFTIPTFDKGSLLDAL